jgi:CBS-domain-containing membrane protein
MIRKGAPRLSQNIILLAVPVVDKNNVIHGIVTADDALDKIIPTAWKKRLPKLVPLITCPGGVYGLLQKPEAL